MIKMTRKFAKAAAIAAIAAAIPAASALAAAPSGKYSCAYTYNTSGFDSYLSANPSSPVHTGTMSYLDFTANTISQARIFVNNFNSTNPAPKTTLVMATGTFTVSQPNFPNAYVLTVTINSENGTTLQTPYSFQFAVEPVNGGNTLLSLNIPASGQTYNGPIGSGVCNRL